MRLSLHSKICVQACLVHATSKYHTDDKNLHHIPMLTSTNWNPSKTEWLDFVIMISLDIAVL